MQMPEQCKEPQGGGASRAGAATEPEQGAGLEVGGLGELSWGCSRAGDQTSDPLLSLHG